MLTVDKVIKEFIEDKLYIKIYQEPDGVVFSDHYEKKYFLEKVCPFAFAFKDPAKPTKEEIEAGFHKAKITLNSYAVFHKQALEGIFKFLCEETEKNIKGKLVTMHSMLESGTSGIRNITKELSLSIAYIDTSVEAKDLKENPDIVESLIDKEEKKKALHVSFTRYDEQPIPEEITQRQEIPDYIFISKFVFFCYRSLRDDLLTKLAEENKELRSASPTEQLDLIPVFRPQKNIELKKDFALNFGAIDKIEEKYPALLPTMLTSGKTLREHLYEVKNWFNSLEGKDLENWLRVFGYMKSVREFAKENPDTGDYNFIQENNGFYIIRTRTDKHFFQYFIKPDKNTGQYTTKAKNIFLKWLYENQQRIEFPFIQNEKVWLVPTRIYEYSENITKDEGKKEILIKLNTNFLDSEFKNYLSIELSELDRISELWETKESETPEFKSLSLGKFEDIPLKFYLTLKKIYTRSGNFENNGYIGNTQKLTKENLNAHLGDLESRLRIHLIKRKTMRQKSENTAKEKETKSLLLHTTFEIANDLGWILSMPKFENDTYTFNLNAGHFDRRDTAMKLKKLVVVGSK